MEQVNYWTLLTDGVPKVFKVRDGIFAKKYHNNTIVSSLVFK